MPQAVNVAGGFKETGRYDEEARQVTRDAEAMAEAGAFAVHIPYVVTWAHELADAPEGHDRYGALERIAELPAWIEARADG